MVIEVKGVMKASMADRVLTTHDRLCVLGFSSPLDREYYSRVINLASDLGVVGRLRVYSGIPRSQLMFLYKHTAALVLLSKYEGFGYPPLEAMAVGTPAIVSDSTLPAKISGQAAVCVRNDEPSQAAEAMKVLAQDSAHRARLSAAGIAHARTFSREWSGQLIRSVHGSCAVPVGG